MSDPRTPDDAAVPVVPAETARTAPVHAAAAGAAPGDAAVVDRTVVRDEQHATTSSAAVPEGELVLQRERERFSGMRFFLGFFGWLTATGLTVLLLALAAGVGAVAGVQTTSTSRQLQGAGIVGAIVLLVVLLVAYFAGGYVAGRMARFSGLKQGLAVWLWGVIIAVVAAVAGAIAGGTAGLAGQLGSVTQLPFTAAQLTLAGVLSALAVLVVTLVGALLGGTAGMRYHRRVDRVGLGRR